ncbi:MAG: ABC transporter ATP-binding protein [Deltaproteobacteria bacterium]|jgi:putative ABC transport system ATP-binding protein|nr:ABC transporter ATP-binding protein [Deltaproteobacteria bacterium]
MSPAQTIIRTKDLKKTYFTDAGGLEVLHGVDFEIQPAEFVAIMGPSGSGKSTFMNILGCLDVPTSGEYMLLGESVGDLSPDQLANRRNRFLGFVFQGFNLLPRADLLENVAMPLLYAKVPGAERNRRAREMLDRVGLGPWVGHRPSQVSGGQQQRAAVARALCGSPSLVLADEPTGNLDSQTSDEIMKLFCELNDQGLTLIVVTHEPDVAAYAKRLVRFHDGLLVQDGPVTDRRRP